MIVRVADAAGPLGGRNVSLFTRTLHTIPCRSSPCQPSPERELHDLELQYAGHKFRTRCPAPPTKAAPSDPTKSISPHKGSENLGGGSHWAPTKFGPPKLGALTGRKLPVNPVLYLLAGLEIYTGSFRRASKVHRKDSAKLVPHMSWVL